MGRYVLQNRGIRDMRHVRPEVVARSAPVVVAAPKPEPEIVDMGSAITSAFLQSVEPSQKSMIAAKEQPVATPSYFKMTKAALIEAATARGVDATGTRPELIGRLSHG